MSPGTCIDCQEYRRDAIMVGAIEAGSGPGVILYACPEHARRRAAWPTAPDYLREEIAALDARDTERHLMNPRTYTADDGGKHGGEPSDKPWTPPPTPPSPDGDGSGGKCTGD